MNEMICFLCPNSCLLETVAEGTEIKVSGNLCTKGQEFAQKELTDPERVLTTTVRVRNRRELLSVRSDRPVKKAELSELVQKLKSFEVDLPIQIGQVLISGMGLNKVSIIATSDGDSKLNTKFAQ
jgi:CxxC motif-containing protein